MYISIIKSTIDLNLTELQYLADHLHIEQCRKLVAALHFKSYEKPNALNNASECFSISTSFLIFLIAEAKITKDTSCIYLLLHWNSSKNEGKGETHEIIQHRLRQIGREDLAEWLGKTTFQELGKDIRAGLNFPFKDLVATEEY